MTFAPGTERHVFYPPLTFTVDGRPVPKYRVRAVRGQRPFTPEPTRRYERAVGLLALEARDRWERQHGMTWPLGREYCVSVQLMFRTGGRLPGDVDNYLKTIKDALRRILYHDDSQVWKVIAERISGTIVDEGAVVEISPTPS